MNVSIIIRKKKQFSSPLNLSVQKIGKYAWKKAQRRKRTLLQKIQAWFKQNKRHVYRINGQIAMF